jgi:RNA polymerase sigma-70 factor, ECF subfamily
MDASLTAALVRRAQAGDADAFEALLAPRLDRLYGTAALIVHDRTLGEDAVQEAMVRAWQGLPGLRDPDRFEAWLHRLLIHSCIDAARSVKHQRTVRQLPIGLVGREDVANRVADRDAVERAFMALSANHRAAFVLRHYLGHTVEGVAAALHVPLGTAKSRLHYAEQAMAAAIEADSRLVFGGGVA